MSDKEGKARFRKQIDELRELWNAFDPIGVMDDPEWPRDEYDRYLPHTLRLLMDGAGTLAIANYVNSMVCDEMGLTGNSAAAYAFACELEEWFARESASHSAEKSKLN
ncbi:MAG: hypothetical protein RLN99_17450 [Kiloniellaceae bacterium]